jgi:hypothetical protein
LDDPKLLAWFAQNVVYPPCHVGQSASGSVTGRAAEGDCKDGRFLHPKLFALPIGLENAHWKKSVHGVETMLKAAKSPKFFEDRKFLLFINFNEGTNPAQRTGLIARFRNFTADTTVPQHQSFQEYVNDISNSKFVLSPPGHGEDCHRTWEAIALGAVPIVLSTMNMAPLFSTAFEAGSEASARGSPKFPIPVLQIKSWDELTPDLLRQWKAPSGLETGGKTWWPRSGIWARQWIHMIKQYESVP